MIKKRVLGAVLVSLLFLLGSAHAQQSATGSITITIAPAQTLVVTTQSSSILNGIIGNPYTSVQFTSTGGVAPITWSKASGVLPTGLTLTASGSLTGTPTTAGVFSSVIRADDAEGTPQSATITVTIIIASKLTIGSGALAGGSIGVAYSQTIPVTGGIPPYNCALSSGSLPSGLTIAGGPTGCTVSGTPSSSGPASGTVTVTDSGTGTFKLGKKLVIGR